MPLWNDKYYMLKNVFLNNGMTVPLASAREKEANFPSKSPLSGLDRLGMKDEGEGDPRTVLRTNRFSYELTNPMMIEDA